MNGSAIAGASHPLAAPGKKARPPTLSLTTSAKRQTPSNTIIELETPLEERQAVFDDVARQFTGSPPPISPKFGTAANSSTTSSSSTSTIASAVAVAAPTSSMLFSPASASTHHDSPLDLSADELARELAVVEQLRRSVQKNLRLRPIQKFTSTSASNTTADAKTQSSPPQSPSASSRPVSILSTWSDYSQARSGSPNSSVNSPSLYYTPLSEAGPGSAMFMGSGSGSSDGFRSGYGNGNGMGSAFGPIFPHHDAQPRVNPPANAGYSQQLPLSETFQALQSNKSVFPTPSPQFQPQSPPQQLSTPARPLDCSLLVSRLLAPTRPLLIDTRPVASYVFSRIQYSINMAIPSLILKRSRKPGAGAFTSITSLKQFITTDSGREEWDKLFGVQEKETIAGISEEFGHEHRHGDWDGDVIVFDEEMNEHERFNTGATAWSLLPVLEPLLENGGSVEYLVGGMKKAKVDPNLRRFILTANDITSTPSLSSGVGAGVISASPGRPPKPLGKKRSTLGLSQLDTSTATRRNLPEVEISRSAEASPLPVMQMSIGNWNPASPNPSLQSFHDATPSPPPSHSSGSFARPPPPRRPSLTALKRLDTKSAERLNEQKRERSMSGTLKKLDTRSAEKLTVNTGSGNGIALPKLSVRTVPLRSATLATPLMGEQWLNGTAHSPGPRSHSPHSPSHLNLLHSNYEPPGSRRTPSPAGFSDHLRAPSPSWNGSQSGLSTPRTTASELPGTPHTARPELSPSMPPSPYRSRSHSFPASISTPNSSTSDTDTETEDPLPPFTVSTILPNFLYLGPELTEEAHVEELKRFGVKRILNIAVECDDDKGLRLRERFERYVRIPMRDTVEEDNISRGVREVCGILDDASLHSAPTYVHCKAGKSRSVTAVMAYLIHANHWTLSRAYTFVLERRKGISPNIGFVSELMNFEEQELGGKSVGVIKGHQPASAGGYTGHDDDYDGEGGGGAGQGSYQVAAAGASRRPGHLRESLPPGFTSMAGGIGSEAMARDGIMGDSGQEMEIRDADGRYRHLRRAPVNENTLQPMRRVSKAGLETAEFMERE